MIVSIGGFIKANRGWTVILVRSKVFVKVKWFFCGLCITTSICLARFNAWLRVLGKNNLTDLDISDFKLPINTLNA